MEGEDWELLKDLERMGLDELEAEIARHEAQTAAEGGAGASTGMSMDDQLLMLDAAPATSSGASSSIAQPAPVPAAGQDSNATPQRLTQELLQRLAAVEAENEKMKAALENGGTGLLKLDSHLFPGTSSTTSDLLKASAARRQALEGMGGSKVVADLERQVAETKGRLEFKQRGVDIAIMMDCTGSMGWCIDKVKAKAQEIMELAPKVHPDAITRLAFVGYRDFPPEDCGAQFVVRDFVEASNFSTLESVLLSTHAAGGGNAEDVTGALKKVSELSWSSSTRLLIHFGDAPCHGNRYHNGCPVTGPDTYPAGNPDGLVPEELLKQLIINRIDYHFARIDRHTDIMTKVFKQVYDESPGAAAFEIYDYTDRGEGFLPVVLKSLTSSMRRSFRASSGRSSAASSKSSVALPGIALPNLYEKLV